MVEPEIGHFLSLKRRTSWRSIRKLEKYLQGSGFPLWTPNFHNGPYINFFSKQSFLMTKSSFPLLYQSQLAAHAYTLGDVLYLKLSFLALTSLLWTPLDLRQRRGNKLKQTVFLKQQHYALRCVLLQKQKDLNVVTFNSCLLYLVTNHACYLFNINSTVHR